MTVGAFVTILIAIHIAVGWMLLIYVMNLYAGYPYWKLVMKMFWPVGIPALIVLLAGIFAQVSFLRKKKKGVPADALPATVPVYVYPLLLAILLAIVSAKWFQFVLDNYSVAVAKRSMGMPILLFVLSILSFATFEWLRKRKK